MVTFLKHMTDFLEICLACRDCRVTYCAKIFLTLVVMPRSYGQLKVEIFHTFLLVKKSSS